MRWSFLLAFLFLGCGADDSGGGGDSDSDSDGDSDADTDADSDGDVPACDREPPPLGDPLTRVARLDNSREDGRGEIKMEVTAIAQDGDRAYGCSNRLALFGMDVAGDSLVRTGQTTKMVCQHVVAAGGRSYVTNHGTRLDPVPFLRIFDDAYREVDEVAQGGVLYEGVDLEGDLLAVTEHERGVELFDVSGGSLASIALVGGFANAFAVEMQAGFAYVADGAGGIQVLDVSDPSAASVVATVETTAPATEIAVEGEALAVAVGSSGTDVFRLDDPATPVFVANLGTRNTTTDVAVAGSFLYTSEWDEVRVWDMGALDCVPVLVAAEADNVENQFSRAFGVHPVEGGLLVAGWETVLRYALDPDLGGPEVSLSIDVLAFGTLEGEESSTQSVVIHNDGDRELAIDGATVEGADFSVDLVPESVPAGGTGYFEVTFTPSGATPVSGRVVLATNDPDEGEYVLDIQGNVPGYGVGDTLPAETAYVDVESGESVTLGDLRGEHVVLAYFATF